ncbi:hypothetical protein Moror_4920 [Moniliophthora roreri MCA 2997]|nr:hypothetical protein Moror_4920 [Moniliophthora roreri MCA 2997]
MRAIQILRRSSLPPQRSFSIFRYPIAMGLGSYSDVLFPKKTGSRTSTLPFSLLLNTVKNSASIQTRGKESIFADIADEAREGEFTGMQDVDPLWPSSSRRNFQPWAHPLIQHAQHIPCEAKTHANLNHFVLLGLFNPRKLVYMRAAVITSPPAAATLRTLLEPLRRATSGNRITMEYDLAREPF